MRRLVPQTRKLVMPGLDPDIHAFLFNCQDVDGRDKPGHDDVVGKAREAAHAVSRRSLSMCASWDSG